MAFKNVSFYGQGPLNQIQQDYASDPRRAMAQQLITQGSNTSPVQSPLEGLARALSGGIGGLAAGAARRDMQDRQTALNTDMMAALGASKAQEFDRPTPDFVGPMQGSPGGTQGMIAELQKRNNPDALPFMMQLQTGQIQQEQAAQQAEIARRKDRADYLYQQQNKSFAPKTPVPGRDVPYSPDVATQLAEIAGATSAAKRPTPTQIEEDAAAKERGKSRVTATKPMPTSALKMQNEALDAIGTVDSINGRLDDFSTKIDSGELELGPFSNLINKGMNLAGMSDVQSRNLSSFTSALEKMRNDSLRLNNGVQTEGDAQRAWKELVENINDPALVKQRLTEIKKLNNKARELRRYQIDVIRSNFGQPPLEDVKPEGGNSGSSASATGSGNATQAPGSNPAGVPQEVWDAMTPEEKALF